jgi:hypothetical protein
MFTVCLMVATVHGPTHWTSTLHMLVANQSWFDIPTSPVSNGILVGCTVEAMSLGRDDLDTYE